PAFGVDDDTDPCHVGFKSFLSLLDQYKPRYMFHGHMHMKFGRAQRTTAYKDTTVIDAYGYYVLDI
ncbi:MAG: metallophosphoesterase, partial [Clostridia bacterium]|nr:metallophosphoesterase [Clostridia bacterium]